MTDLSKLVKVKGLIWIGPDNNGGFYVPVYLNADFSAYYTIEQCDYGLATVEYGVHCHEFGSTVIWKGPKDQAQAAAQADYEARVMAALEPTEMVGELVERAQALVANLEEGDFISTTRIDALSATLAKLEASE